MDLHAGFIVGIWCINRNKPNITKLTSCIIYITEHMVFQTQLFIEWAEPIKEQLDQDQSISSVFTYGPL